MTVNFIQDITIFLPDIPVDDKFNGQLETGAPFTDRSFGRPCILTDVDFDVAMSLTDLLYLTTVALTDYQTVNHRHSDVKVNGRSKTWGIQNQHSVRHNYVKIHG